ncbi:MAG: type II toxin-antitoxin system RelE/ParE family toxin [Polyangiaceae bacterium]
MSRPRDRRAGAAAEAGSSNSPKFRLRWTQRAILDLEEIDAYIAADDPIAAQRWVNRLVDHAAKAAWTPYAGRVVPEFGRTEIRELLLRSYRIVYRIRGDEIQVLTVFEGHRLFPTDVSTDPDPE